MRDLSPRYEAAAAAIDQANAADPNIVEVRGRTSCPRVGPRSAWPRSGSSDWSTTPTSRCCSRPALTTCVAGSCARDSYPAGRAGYLRWRRDQKARHATDVAAILEPCGYDAAEIERVQRLIRRESVDGTQAVEDAACLVFIETQLASIRGANRARSDHRRHPQDGPQDESRWARIWSAKYHSARRKRLCSARRSRLGEYRPTRSQQNRSNDLVRTH